MADKMQLDGDGNGVGRKPNWTDALPHDFIGWGPQTPDRPYSSPEQAPLAWARSGDAHWDEFPDGEADGGRIGFGQGAFSVAWDAELQRADSHAPYRYWCGNTETSLQRAN